MKRMNVWLAFACALATLTQFTPGLATSAWADTSSMRFGIEAQYPPFESKDASGHLRGLDADIVAGRLDATLVLAPAGQKGFLSRPDGKGFAFVGQPVRDEKILGSGIAFGIRRGDDALRTRLDAAIEKLQADGVVKALARKYLGDIDVSVK